MSGIDPRPPDRQASPALPRFAPVHINSMQARLALPPAKNGAIPLPNLILWALHLNAGELLTVDRVQTETFRCRFTSYGDVVRTLADWDASARWPFLQQNLRLPMAAIAPRGHLLLPREAAPLEESGGPIWLTISPLTFTKRFALEPAGGSPPPEELYLQASYVLPLQGWDQVRLPKDVVWLSGLREGDLLACKLSLGQVDFEPFVTVEPLAERTLSELGPGGTLQVPEAFFRNLQPGWRIELIVTFRPQPSFRLHYVVDLPQS